jgi:uncharacterized protein YbjT (DUF2867 family)
MGVKTFAIVGASGNVGHVIAKNLLDKGHHVRAISRNDQGLEPLKAKGAEIYVLDVKDTEALTKAFQGVDAVFALLPPFLQVLDPVQHNENGESIAKAIEQANVPYVVNLSSLGAQLSEGTGPIISLYKQEQRLNKLEKLNVVHVRPAYFMQNLIWSIPIIKYQGLYGSTESGILPIEMVDTHDVALKCVELLENLSFTNHSVIELIGPRAYTLNDATSILGRAVGIPNLKYVQFPMNDAKKALLANGYNEEQAKIMLEFERAVNDEKLAPTQEIANENRCTGTLEDFAAREFAPKFNATAKASEVAAS